MRAQLYSSQKNSCFVSGHDFSRAVNKGLMRALAPEAVISWPLQNLFSSPSVP
jgi:hypothetical protein